MSENDNVVQQSLHELFDRIERLENDRSAPRGKEDIADEIFAHYEADTEDQWVQSVHVDYEHVGPLGGKSSTVLLKLQRPGKVNRHKYVIVQVYDDERIQQAGARIVQKLEAEDRNARGF